MKIDYLLYSRTIAKDYRWILSSQFLDQQDSQIVQSFVDQFFKIKEFFSPKATSEVLYSQVLFLNKSVVILSCGKSQYKDNVGRAIYYVKGLAIGQQDISDFTNHFSYVWNRVDSEFDSWGQVEFSSADSVERKVLSINIELSNMSNSKTADATVSLSTSAQAKGRLKEIGFLLTQLGERLIKSPESIKLETDGESNFESGIFTLKKSDYPDIKEIAEMCQKLREAGL